jgi:hypothetical protein
VNVTNGMSLDLDSCQAARSKATTAATAASIFLGESGP